MTLINDSIYEGDETLSLSIIPPDNQSDVETATITITDNEDSKIYYSLTQRFRRKQRI